MVRKACSACSNVNACHGSGANSPLAQTRQQRDQVRLNSAGFVLQQSGQIQLAVCDVWEWCQRGGRDLSW